MIIILVFHDKYNIDIHDGDIKLGLLTLLFQEYNKSPLHSIFGYS